jgi:hypothetical protein
MQPTSPRRDRITELPYPLKLFLLLSAGLTILSFGYTIVCRRIGLGLPYSFPYYYVPGNMFKDFYSFHDKFRQWGTPAFFDHRPFGYFMYPAPLVHVFRFLLGLHHAQTQFLCLMLLTAAGLAAAFVRVLRNQGLELQPKRPFRRRNRAALLSVDAVAPAMEHRGPHLAGGHDRGLVLPHRTNLHRGRFHRPRSLA